MRFLFYNLIISFLGDNTMFDSKYFLESTSDMTDRTAEIQKYLDEFGVCILGAGLYVVNGVDMPDGSTVMGMGKATQVLLDPAAEEGYAISLRSFCTVKNLGLMGSLDTIELPEKVGERHGLLFRGTATTKNWQTGQPLDSMIDGCFMTGFTGGGITCVDTGYYVRACLTVVNCHIVNCGAGINISHYSEFHKFTNVVCYENLYGCINNGGNNTFTACSFDANVTGYMIDNSMGQSPNDSHGSVIGCTFNHSDNNEGIGILIMGAKNGYIFTGCQLFYSKIVLENSTSMVFSDFNFGRNTEISVKGGKLTKFSDCAFANMPTVTVEDNDKVRFSNCFTRDGEEVRSPSVT